MPQPSSITARSSARSLRAPPGLATGLATGLAMTLALGLGAVACGTEPELAPTETTPRPAPAPAAPASREALFCAAPAELPAPEENQWGPARRREPEDPRDLCAVADSNIARVEAEILALPTPAQAPADPPKSWDHKKDPAGLGKVARRFGLAPEDLALLRQNGFVVADRFGVEGYAWAYHEVFQSELPVYVSLDAIFAAVQVAHDHVLGDLEARRLAPVLADALARMHCGLAAAAASYPADTAKDLDVYLTVARRLLEPTPPPTALGDAATEVTVADLLERALAADALAEVDLFGRPRVIDFTQLQPRGHYAGDPALEPYFRAAMWLARTELNLVSRSSRSSAPGEVPDPRETPREAVLALALADLAARTGAMPAIDTLDRAWELFAGRREDVSLRALTELGQGIHLDDPKAAETLRARIGDRFQRTARTHYMPQGSTVLPAIATLLGPRVVPDAAATRPLVHGAIPERYRLHGADFAYVLGADRARAHLVKDLSEFPALAEGLAEARRVLAAAPRTDDLYTAWLDAIRGAAAPASLAGPTLPSFMATEAFADLRVNTTIAAFAGLRHNHVLVAAQSYDEGGCVIPDGWVEPAPAAYDALLRYADRGAAVVAELDPSDAGGARAYFARLGQVLRVLKAIGDVELAGRPLPEPMRRFLGQVVEMAPGSSGGPPTYTGWYFDLFQRREEDGLKGSDLVADVYTSSNAGITYLGTGAPLLGVFVVDRGGPPRVMVGPVARAYEHLGPLARRLDDEAAKALPAAAREAPWAASYLAPAPPEPSFALDYGGGFEDPGDGKAPDPDLQVITVEAKEALGKVTVSFLDHHRVAVKSLTKVVGPGTTRFAFRVRASPEGPGFEGISIRIGRYQRWTPIAMVCSCAGLRTGTYAVQPPAEDEAPVP